mmetsp:Transcript_14691/g.16404  ORF Transcript_14691/g.16404 Transcript_14691/m.16404 type:complete len:308 (-) Transcript_14691:44-967(-)
MRLLLLSVCLLAFLTTINAWSSTGHLITSTIAYNDLKKNDPKTLEKAEAILEPLSKFFMEPDHAFIAAAEWPDDIKGQQWKNYNILHFLNTPVIDPSFEGNISIPVDNAITLYTECMKTLSKAKGPAAVIGKSMCMRFIIHIVGDIHQPLHTATLFSAEFPDGDMGGNKFEIFYPKKHSLKELHQFWDATANKYSASIKVPITENYFTKLQVIAEDISLRYNRDTLSTKLKVKSFEDWTKESGKLALEIAYGNLEFHSGDTITEEYDTLARETIDQQLALGGLRLANALKTALKYTELPEVKEYLSY